MAIALSAAVHRTRSHELEAIADGVVRQWESFGGRDLTTAQDALMRELMRFMHHQLRQHLAVVQARLELATLKGRNEMNPAEATNLLQHLDAINELAHRCLDPIEAAKLLIRIHRQPLDLRDLVQRIVAREPARLQDHLRLELDPVTADLDSEKVEAALAGLLHTVEDLAGHDEPITVRLDESEGKARVLFQLGAAWNKAEGLMAAVLSPMDLDKPTADASYARAVAERHGGAVVVSGGPNDTLSLIFEVPTHGGEA